MYGIILFSLCLFCSSEVSADKKLIVVLVDGMRWDYIDDPKLKGISRIIENGVRAPYVTPVYPSLSYPNYQTIATGLYPENHGFVHNVMYDNDTDRYFGMIPHPGSTDPYWWNVAEPIWTTAERKGRTTAVYWWAGCEVEISQTHTTICERQRFGPPDEEETMDFLERIDDIVLMFKPSKRFPKDRLSLALMYYGGVDYAGHHSGAKSLQLKEALYDIDNILDQMQTKLKEAGLEDKVNIMVVADHGMTDVKEFSEISLEKFSSKIKYQLGSAAQSMILPLPGMVEKLYDEIKKENIEGLRVYKREDIPEQYHLKGSARVLPIFLMAKNGYLIKKLQDTSKRLAGGPPHKNMGHHGYDPDEVEDMRTIFFATGPDFRKGINTEPLQTTDLYNVMCSILELEPLPNNGSFDRVKPMLTKYETHQPVTSSAAGFGKSYSCICFTIFTVINWIIFRNRF